VKILIIASYPFSLVNFRGDLINGLIERGLEVHACAPDLNGETEVGAELLRRGVVIHSVSMNRTGLNPLKDIRTIVSFFLLIKRLSPDFVLAYTVKPVLYGMIAAFLAGVPNRVALITGLGYAFSGEQRLVPRMVALLVRYFYVVAVKVAHLTVFQNQDDKDLFHKLKILGFESNAIVVNGSGVNLNYYAKKSIFPDRITFLLIARLIRDKGIQEFVDAAQLVKREWPEARFLLAGPIDSNPNGFKAKDIERWQSDGCIEYLGELKDVREALAETSVYVLPSYREGTPRTVLEAMSIGRPIITSDAPGCRETVVDGFNGFTVPVKSVAELKDRMISFLEDPEMIERMGSRSREVAMQKYDVDKVNSMIFEAMFSDGKKAI
jgi:glycosyltransferase involved in cell wall biosynthesis